jgi:hypothetical protein
MTQEAIPKQRIQILRHPSPPSDCQRSPEIARDCRRLPEIARLGILPELVRYCSRTAASRLLVTGFTSAASLDLLHLRGDLAHDVLLHPHSLAIPYPVIPNSHSFSYPSSLARSSSPVPPPPLHPRATLTR